MTNEYEKDNFRHTKINNKRRQRCETRFHHKNSSHHKTLSTSSTASSIPTPSTLLSSSSLTNTTVYKLALKQFSSRHSSTRSSVRVVVEWGPRKPIWKSNRPPIHGLLRSSTPTWASTSLTRPRTSGLASTDRIRREAQTHRQQATIKPTSGPINGMNRRIFWNKKQKTG